MKLCFISDTHGGHKWNLKWGDVLCHTGDAEIHSMSSLVRFCEWLAEQRHDHKIYVPGNHDEFLFNLLYDDEVPYDVFEEYGVTCLIDKGITLAPYGIEYNFYGSPWSLTYGDWGFMGSEEDLKPYWDKIPDNTDILLTHSPPLGVLDNVGYWSTGSEGLFKKVMEVDPIIHAFGHIHCDHGMKKVMNTFFINSALGFSLNYKLKYPVIVELEDKQIADFYILDDQ